ncbi:DgyrCDS10558 [Dimorphilus gyrociliatus]|uniref:DgyrCDS10558 n=1 Tax=Dimorphilus gyrociliatus TaxID=2664684 RepID=A0A7I8W1P5_9ANNE|nr:DgyrCDS10558 [Dimorphilus gyrociliatus]
MNWWDSASLSNFATKTLKTAQKKIDKVLDIQEDEEANVTDTKSVVRKSTDESTKPKTFESKDHESFWNTWFDNSNDGQESSSKSVKEICQPSRSSPQSSVSKFKVDTAHEAAVNEDSYTLSSNFEEVGESDAENIMNKKPSEEEAQRDFRVQRDELLNTNDQLKVKQSYLESSTFAVKITDSFMSAKGDWTNESVLLPEGDLMEIDENMKISADLKTASSLEPAGETTCLNAESDTSTLERTLDSESTEGKESINIDRTEAVDETESSSCSKEVVETISQNIPQEDRPFEECSDQEPAKDDKLGKIRNSSSSSTIIPEEVTISNTSSSDSRAELSDSNQTIIVESELTNSVKNLLEDAMTEVNKDSNSTDSNGRSSIDVLKLDSGHTSADEIETTTSSDIEILSIPTPNGDKDRTSASPVRQLMSKVVRRSSPPSLHQRSDSGSSFDSVGRQFVACQSLSSENDPFRSEKLLKKLGEMAEILDVREHKLLELSKENIELQETGNLLKNQVQDAVATKEKTLTEIKNLAVEYEEKFAKVQSLLSQRNKEVDDLVNKNEKLQSELKNKIWDTSAIEKALKEKEQIIAELLEEGEKLSKQQLQNSIIIKKLRAKEKDNDQLSKSNSSLIEKQKNEIEYLKKVIDSKEELLKKQAEAITQQNAAVQSQENDMIKLKSDFEDAEEKCRGLQATLEKAYKEIAGLHKEKATKASEEQEAALSRDLFVQEQLRSALEQYKREAKEEEKSLFSQIEDLQQCLSKTERELRRKEDCYKQEINDLQQRLQEADDRHQDLTGNVTAATRPLLRQIENLQASFSEQTSTYEVVEKNLQDRLNDAQMQTSNFQERERLASEKVMQLNAKIMSLESQLSTIRNEKSHLLSDYEVTKAKLLLAEDSRTDVEAKLRAKTVSLEHEISDLKKQNIQLNSHLEMESMKIENERKKVLAFQEQLQDKEMQLQLQINPSDSISMNESMFSKQSSSGRSTPYVSHDDLTFPSTIFQNKTSLYDNLRNFGNGNVFEALQSTLKQREGEIVQLQSEIKELERNRESMMQELVKVTNNNLTLSEKLIELDNLKKNYKELDSRYQALLQMYGEKVEEAEELKLDLQDVKAMYRCQIEELVRKS